MEEEVGLVCMFIDVWDVDIWGLLGRWELLSSGICKEEGVSLGVFDDVFFGDMLLLEEEVLFFLLVVFF